MNPPALMSCAQRLTASEVWAPRSERRNTCSGLVLNALRHQRFGHDGANVQAGIILVVLNALRHQRFGHIRYRRAVSSLAECSTPYGIRGLGTDNEPEGIWPTICAQRLTASEVWARKAGVAIQLSGECSTPYGIRGLGTPPFGHNGTPLIRAQRLTASEVWAR